MTWNYYKVFTIAYQLYSWPQLLYTNIVQENANIYSIIKTTPTTRINHSSNLQRMDKQKLQNSSRDKPWLSFSWRRGKNIYTIYYIKYFSQTIILHQNKLLSNLKFLLFFITAWGDSRFCSGIRCTIYCWKNWIWFNLQDR